MLTRGIQVHQHDPRAARGRREERPVRQDLGNGMECGSLAKIPMRVSPGCFLNKARLSKRLN